MRNLFAVILLFCPLANAQQSLSSPSAEGAELYLIEVGEGDSLPGEVTLRFGLRGMGVAPSGFDAPNTGHHHLLIDVETLPDMALPLPKTDNILHYGCGQTEATVTLSPGSHTLQLLLGNYLHVPHSPPVVSERITVTVEE